MTLRSIKAHHHVALANFETWVSIDQGLGNTPACSRADLVEALKLRGHRIVLAPHPVETGLRMLAVDPEGQLIEYLERRCGSRT